MGHEQVLTNLIFLVDSTVLEANTPIVGYGPWFIESGEGGSFEDETDPSTIFHGIAGILIELRWEIFMACWFYEDYVTISFAEPFICGDQLIDDRDGQILQYCSNWHPMLDGGEFEYWDDDYWYVRIINKQ